MLIFKEKSTGGRNMTFFLFRRVAIGNRNSGIKQTIWSKVMKSWRNGVKSRSIPTHSATKLMSNLPEKSWASARSSSLSNWRVCWLWSFHRVSKVAVKGGHNLRPPHGERESTRKLGSKKLAHKKFLLRKWRENGVECPPSRGSFEGWLESPELGIVVPDSLCPGLLKGPCEEINPREKKQNGTQENPKKNSRRRKGESPAEGITTTKSPLHQIHLVFSTDAGSVSKPGADRG